MSRRYAPKVGVLNPAEKRWLQLVADGCSDKEAAEKMHCSPHTAKWYAKVVRAAIGARTRSHAVAIGIREGWIQ